MQPQQIQNLLSEMSFAERQQVYNNAGLTWLEALVVESDFSSGIEVVDQPGEDMPASSPLSLDSGIEEDLTGVDNEENTSVTNPWIVAAMVAVAILVGILSWFFGFGDQVEDFARENGLVDQIKDWTVQLISSIFNNRSLE